MHKIIIKTVTNVSIQYWQSYLRSGYWNPFLGKWIVWTNHKIQVAIVVCTVMPKVRYTQIEVPIVTSYIIPGNRNFFVIRFINPVQNPFMWIPVDHGWFEFVFSVEYPFDVRLSILKKLLLFNMVQLEGLTKHNISNKYIVEHRWTPCFVCEAKSVEKPFRWSKRRHR